jgi:hypothetical protein
MWEIYVGFVLPRLVVSSDSQIGVLCPGANEVRLLEPKKEKEKASQFSPNQQD